MGPLVLSQGKAVRREMLRQPKPEGPRQGEIGQGTPLTLLILGDSLAAGVGVQNQDQALVGQLMARLAPHVSVRWQLEAETCWTTYDGLDTLSEVDDGPYDIALIALGVNDVTTDVGRARWLERYRLLVQRLQTHQATWLVLVLAVPPVAHFPTMSRPLRWYLRRQARSHDRALARWARTTPGLHHLPFPRKLKPAGMATDGFSPDARIYAAWAESAAEVILAKAARPPA